MNLLRRHWWLVSMGINTFAATFSAVATVANLVRHDPTAAAMHGAAMSATAMWALQAYSYRHGATGRPE